jgi:hypothetical protein
MVVPKIQVTQADMLFRDLRGRTGVSPLLEPSNVQDYFLRSAVFWVVIPRTSEKAPNVSSTLKIEAICSSETSVSLRPARRYDPQSAL